MNNSDNIMLSICVPTYNHEDYIVKALDSILMQKTDYKFEILVGEDCSTDSTRHVLKEYEANHPGKLQVFYREQNMHKTYCTNARDLKLRCRGKYIATLEGDDFWTDEYKLQKQISFLESHPEYYAISHRCVVVGENNLPNGEEYPQCEEAEYSFKHFFSEIMPGQLATLMYRNIYLDEGFDNSLTSKGLTPGDRLLYFSLLCHGKIYCSSETMSAYRHITTHGSSFSATNKFNYSRQKPWNYELLEFAKKYCGKSVIINAEYLYFYTVFKALFLKQISISQAFSDCRAIKHKFLVVFVGLKRLINKRVLKIKLYA